jgi:TonB family protein
MFRRLALLFFLITLSTAAFAEDTLSHLRADYQKKVFLLRGFYQDSQLHYDTAGHLQQQAHTGPWTTAFVYINSLDSKNGKLTFKTSRVVQIFDAKKQMFRPSRTRQSVVIEVDAELPNEAALRQALANVFLDAHDPLAQLVPDYWRGVVERMAYDGVLRPEPKMEVDRSKCDPAPTTDSPCFLGGVVKAPIVISSPDPDYPEFARAFKFEGTVVLWTMIDETGHTAKTRIVRPLGFGLDDKAVEAVRRWTFHPATHDGQPVPVQINVEVNFRLY